MNNCKLFGVRVHFTDKKTHQERYLINYYLVFSNGRRVRINDANWKDTNGKWHTDSETNLSVLAVIVDSIDDVVYGI